MKNVLLFCLLLASAAARGQTKPETDGAYYSGEDAAAARKLVPAPGQEAPSPFKGANTIIVHTSDSAAVAFRKAAMAVLTSGYSPTEKDGDLLYLLTGFRPLSKSSFLRVSIRVHVRPERNGSAISFTGTFASQMADLWVNGATPMTARAEYRPGNLMKAWSEVLRVANGLPGGQYAYARLP